MGTVGNQKPADTIPVEVQKLIDETPVKFLSNYYSYKDKPYGEEALEKAFRSAADKDVIAATQFSHLIRGKPYENEVMKTAYTNYEKTAPEMILWNDHWLKNKPYAEELTKKAEYDAIAHGRPDAVLYTAPHLLENKDYRAEILSKAFDAAVTLQPEAVIEMRKLLDGNPRADEILESSFRSAAQDKPATVIRNLDVLLTKPYGKEVIALAIDNAVDLAPGELTGLMTKHPGTAEGA